MMLKAALHTLGCKLNQYETQRMVEAFEAAGFEIVEFGEPADVAVINTCTVTAKTDHRCRGAIRKAVKSRTPGPLVAVTGCYAEMFPRQAGAIQGVDLVLGNAGKQELPARVLELLGRGTGSAPGRAITGFRGHTRAFVRVQDGCDNACAYCIVTLARGPSRSVPLCEVLDEVGGLVEAGFKELALVGVHLGAWGRDLKPARSFPELLEAVLGLGSGFRIRLSSMEPMEIGGELIELMAREPRVCAHMHIPMQSGSDSVLRRMNRAYDSASYSDLVRRLAGRLAGMGIGADVMVGFPGETDKEFGETAALIESLPLSYLHVFNYSIRPGTPAAAMPDQVDPETRAGRSRELRSLGQEKSRAFRLSQVGAVRPALIESGARTAPGAAAGVTDNYIKVQIGDCAAQANEIVRVSLTGLRGKGMSAEPEQ